MAESGASLGNSGPPDSNIVTADSLSYWNNISADVNGMLGGYPQVSRIDLQGSRNFITKVRRLTAKSNPLEAAAATSTTTSTTTSPTNQQQQQQQQNKEPTPKKLSLCADCGAGIGRVTEGLLTQICDVVDAVEPVAKFASVLSQSPLRQDGQIGDIYVQGLERWEPSKKYDLIWNQWCVGHLTDAQLTAYLRRAAGALSPGGWIGVKENLSTSKFGEDIFDQLDSSVTRSDANFLRIFDDAGLEVVKAEIQTGFPKSLALFPVKLYALRPKQEEKQTD